MRQLLLLLTLLLITDISFAQVGTASQNHYPNSVCIDGQAVDLVTVTFTQSTFTQGCEVTDVDVRIDWAKTDGTCANPTGAGYSYHGETGFRLEAPQITQDVAVPGTWTGGASSPNSVIIFFSSGNTVIPGPGAPVSGSFASNPNNASNSMDNFVGTSALGTWNLIGIDQSNLDPLLVGYASVTVTTAIDNTGPTIALSVPGATEVTPGVYQLANTPGQCSRTVTHSATATDLCGVASLNQVGGQASNTSFSVGDNIISYQAADIYGNSPVRQFTIRVVDTEQPALSCPSSTSVNTASGMCSAVVNSLAPTASDNCGLSSVTYAMTGATTGSGVNDASGETFNAGVTTVTYTATDVHSNTSTCSFTVTVVDAQLPTIACPANIAVNNDAGQCGALVSFSVTANDNCSATVSVPSGQTLGSGSVFPLGVTNLTYIATDPSGNSASCSFSVTVTDNEDPTISCPSNVVVGNDPGQCTANVSWTAPIGSDNCPGAVTVQTSGPSSPFDFPIGVTTISYQVTDAMSQTASCSFTVTVNDTENPTITCPSDITTGVDAGDCGAIVTYAAPVGTDNCPGPVTSLTSGSTTESGDFFNVGTTPVSFQVVDASGNTAQCSFNVTVVDDEFPTFPLCPSDTIFVNTFPGNCDATVNFAVLAQDNCPGLTTAPAVPQGSGTVFNIGSTNVSVTATDNAGNASTCSFTVTVEDNEFPVISCLISEENVTFPNCQYSVPDYIAQGQVNASDNCVGLSTSQSPAAGTVITESTVVILTGTDASGNESSCAITINPLDLYPPVIGDCPTRDLVNTSSGDCSFIIPEYDAASLNATDSCNMPLTFTQSPFPGTVSTQDSVLVTIDVSDGTNVTTCSFYAVGADVTPPSITCPANVVESVDNDCDFEIPSYLANVAALSDNCSADANITLNQLPVSTTVSGAGTVQPILITATDEAGNLSQCWFNVTLTDAIAPTLACPATITKNFNANCQYVLEDLTALVTNVADNCTPASSMTVTQSPSVGTSIGGASAVVTFSVTDASGNSSSCQSTIAVQDVTAPIANCPSDQVQVVDASCSTALADYTTMVSATDNCPSLSTVTVTQVAPTAPGTVVSLSNSPITVQMLVSDGTNSTTCEFDVVLQDQIPPTLVCPPGITLSANNNCQASVPNFTSQVAAQQGTTDNCTPVASLSFAQSPAVGSNVTVGTTVVTVTGTDASGNSSTCTVSVTVEDNNSPTITCPTYSVTAVADANCQVTLADYRTLAVTSDFCDQNVSVSQSPAAGTVSAPHASPTITLTATDDNNNTSSCTFTVTNVDQTAPSITCPATQTVNADGACSYLLPDYTNAPLSLSDNCDASVTVTQSPMVNSLQSGNTTVVLTATDDAGNISSCTFLVQSADNTAPSIICPADQEVSSSIVGNNCVFIVPDLTASATVSDNCTVSALIGVQQSPATGTTITANQTIMLTATDASGNVSTCTFDLLLNDDAAPTITCPGSFEVEVDANCAYAVGNYEGMATASDNCSNAPTVTQSVSPNTNTLTAGDVLIVTLTATDDSLNAASCQFNITAVDAMAPQVVCPSQNDTVSANGSCLVALPDYTGSYFALDNCDQTITTLSQVPIAGTAIVDSVQVTLYATDGSGNQGSCSFWVIREDDTPPTIISCPQTVQYVPTDASCQYTIPDLRSLVLVDDNCDQNLTLTQASMGSIGSGVAPITVSVVVTDDDGNSSTCQLNVAGADITAPTLSCPADQVVSAGANCNHALQSYTAGYSDNCTSAASSTAQSPSAGLIGVGVTTVTLSATDASGNTGSCSFTITVEDNEAPFIFGCPNDITVSNDPTICGAVVSYSEVNAFDNCANFIVPQLISGQLSGTIFPVTTTTVVWTADDGNGNTTTCTFDVTVQDTEAPIIVCPSNITQPIDAGNCSAVVTYALPSVTDNCTSPITPVLVSGGASGSVFTVGTSTVTFSATDAYGNDATCSFDVTVVDDEEPQIVCPADITVSNDPGSCDATVTYALPSVTDNCTSGIVPTLTSGLASGSIFPFGSTTVEYEAEDVSGNVASCAFTITVQDGEDPNIICPNDTSIMCDATIAYDAATATDNCALSVTVTELPNGGFILGNNTVTFIADDGNGNSSTCSFTVTIIDTVAPVIDTCPADQYATFDALCNLTLPDYTGATSATDNCDIPSISQSPSAGTVVAGATVVTMTAEDVSGNISTCQFNVLDDQPPLIVCPENDTVGFNISCAYALLDYTGLATASDNCGAVSLTQSLPQGTLISGQITITITAEDDFGNTATCDFDVVPFDNIDPSISCIGNQTVLADANCEYILLDYRGSIVTNDNCDVQPDLVQTPVAGTVVSGLASVNVVITSTDDAGNENFCSFTVSPLDNHSPTITCPSTQVELTDAQCQITLSDYTTLAVTDDACNTSVVTVSQSPAVGSVLSGNNLITLTANDGNGNTSSCVFLVEAVDQMAPSVACPPDQVATFNANCQYLLGDFTALGVASDNCATQFIITQSPAVGTPVSASTQITLTANDGSGNTASCTFQVTPADNIAPQISCLPDLTLSFDANCQFAIGDYSSSVIASDNCTDANLIVITQSPAGGTVVSGTTLVTMTATDEAGNQGTCSFTVNGTDDEPPVITCPADLFVSVGSNCGYALTDYTSLPQVSDNCATNITVTQDVLTGIVITAATEVTLTANDGNGNASSCSFQVIPEDNTDPVVSCPGDQTVEFGPNCTFELDDYKNLTTWSDNCGFLSVTQDPAAETLVTGQTTVTMTVVDLSGNTVSCSFEVIPQDNTDPVITCPSNTELALDENCQALIDDYTSQATYSDNCSSNLSVSQFPPAGTVVITDTEVTLSTEDDAGNTVTCSFMVSTEDTISPTASSCPQDVVVALNAQCSYTLADHRADMTASDNCDAQLQYVQQPAAGYVIQGVDTVTVQVAAVDDAGNYVLCTFTVQTTDDADPVIQCPADQLLALTASCSYIVPDYSTLATVSDACGGNVSVSQSPAAGSVITSQLNATLIAEDEQGNTATCTFFVDLIPYEMSVTGTDATCQGGNDGTATVTISGGTPPYAQDWGGFDPMALAPGTYAVSVSDANGCVLVGQVTIGDGPMFELDIDPSGEVFICQGTSLTVDAGPGFADYDWSTGASVQTITVVNQGTYWVTVTNAEGCVANDTVSVSFFNTQVPTILTQGDGLLYCSNDTAQSYQWFLNGDPVPNATQPQYCPSQSGNYVVQIVDANGCTLSSQVEEHTFDPDSPCATGIDEYGLTLEVYPNPSNGVFTVNYSLDHRAMLQLSVVDLLGRQVGEGRMLNALSGKHVLDMSQQANGVYLLHIVKDGQKVVQQRLMLVK